MTSTVTGRRIGSRTGGEPSVASVPERYRALRRSLDHFQAGVRDAYADQIRCAAGCSACCRTRLSVFSLEADEIRHGIASLPPERSAALRRRLLRDEGEAAEHCALLVDGACAIYDVRPLICRIHGLPNASRSYPQGAIDLCELNFQDVEADEIAPAVVLDWDHVGQELALLDFEHREARGREAYGRLRIPLVEVARQALDLPADAPAEVSR